MDDVLFFEVTLAGWPFPPQTWYVRNPRNDLIGVSKDGHTNGDGAATGTATDAGPRPVEREGLA